MNGKVKRWAKEMGFVRIGKTAFGLLGGYCFSLSTEWYECTLSVCGFFPNREVQSRMGQMLHDPGVMRENGFSGVLFREDSISFQFQESRKGIRKMKEFLVWLIPALRKNGFSDTQVCCHCHLPFQGNEGEYVIRENRVLKVHENCLTQLRASSELYREGRFKGFLFSFLFAFLGSLPSLYLSVFGWNIPILAMITVFAAYKGYEMSRARRGTPAVWILLLSSFLGYLLSFWIGNGLNRALEIGWKTEEPDTLLLFLRTCISSGFFFFFSCLFIVFSVLFTARDLKDDAKIGKIKHIDKHRYNIS